VITFLYDLPDLGVAAVFGLTIGILFAIAPLLRYRLFGPVSDTHAESARNTVSAITGFTGAVLAFSLVQAQMNLRNVEKTVAAEATQFNQIDRLLTRWGDPKVAGIRQALHAYAQSVIDDEWPRLSVHESSPRTAEASATLSRAILAIQPAPGRESVIYADLLKLNDQLAESRDERLSATDLGLPPIYWHVICFLILLLLVFAAFVEPQWGRVMSLGGLGAGLGLLITLVFIFDQPFLGEVSVTPDPIVRALATMQARAS